MLKPIRKPSITESLKRIQALPERNRKIILWLIVAAAGLILFFIFIKGVEKTIKDFEAKTLKESLGLPQIEKELKEAPKIEMPEISEEELKVLEEEAKKLEESYEPR